MNCMLCRGPAGQHAIEVGFDPHVKLETDTFGVELPHGTVCLNCRTEPTTVARLLELARHNAMRGVSHVRTDGRRIRA